jgi:excisionase family DNA binding protein
MERMPAEPHLWKTQQAAEALGLSVSTLKRLVDAGEIRAARTVGGHRLIPLEELVRFARERDLPLARMGREPESPAALAASPETLAAALRRGRAGEARSLVLGAFGAGGAVGLADGLVRPAMEAVGHEWSDGSLDVFQEHRATRIVEAALMDLIGRMPRPRPPGRGAGLAPLAVGAGPEGDPYTLPGLLCELALRERGWDVMNLGPNLPMASLAKAVLAHQPRLVWISASHLADPAGFLRDYATFHAAASKTGAAVILGGQALVPELRARLASAGFGERVAHLAEFARTLARPADGRGARADRPTDRDDTSTEPQP